MAVTINATTTQGLLVTPDNSGLIQFQLNGVNVPSPSTVPCFSAYLATSNQSVTSSTWTALAAQTEEFDTASCYNNTGSTVSGIPAYSFMPNVAGYYQISGEINSTGSGFSQGNISIYKNGSEFKRGIGNVGGSFSQYGMPVSALVYLNGSTDYVTLYGVIVGTSPVYVNGSGAWCYFQGVLARAA